MSNPSLTMREAILKSLKGRGVASNKEIRTDAEAELGELNPVLFRQCITRLFHSHILRRQGHGLYALENSHEFKTASVSEQFESRITSVLRSCGGIARTADIHRALWDRPRGGTDRPYEYRLVTQTLRNSPQFHQDFGRGLWNLSAEDRDKLPLLGRWASRGLGDEVPNYESRDRQFRDVGYSFSVARADLEVPEVTQDPQVRAALHQIGNNGACRSIALREIRADTDSDVELTVADIMVRQEKVSDYLYLLFENGEASVHLSAPMGLYEGCARLFGVDAAGLSRGRLVPAKIESPVVPDKK